MFVSGLCNVCYYFPQNLSLLQAVSLATPETLVKTSKDWVPLFIAYASAKSTAAEDAETDEPVADDTEATERPSKTGDGVSLVSAIGGRCRPP